MAKENEPKIEKPRTNPPSVETEWDVVDEASYESFPASDPPSYAGHAHDEPKRQ